MCGPISVVQTPSLGDVLSRGALGLSSQKLTLKHFGLARNETRRHSGKKKWEDFFSMYGDDSSCSTMNAQVGWGL